MACDAARVPPLLHVHGFSVHRRDGFCVELPALELEAGRVAALYGPSGCGKTSLCLGLFGLLRGADFMTAGTVRLLDRDVAGAGDAERRGMLRNDVAFLMQDAHAALDPLQAVGAQIAQATSCSAADAANALERLGVQDAAALCRRLPHQISGGQAQRVLLAIAVLRKPALVVADEPSASLDGGNYAELVARLRTLLAAGSSLLLATHDHRLLEDLDAAVYALRDGKFVPGAPVEAPWPARPAGPDPGTVEVLGSRGLCVGFGERLVLDGVDFAVARGEVVAIVGESGAGKTTLARVLAGHRTPDAGSVQQPARRGAVQLCCQDATGSLTPRRTLRALVKEACVPFFPVEHAAAGLQLDPAVLDREVAQMSGGERRRATLLRALAVQPDVLVLDEPTASLDREAAVAVLRALIALQQDRGIAIVLITHDLDLARAVAHRVVAVQGGKLCPY
jgi:peptide/nickel transport system ATP-binding protein